MLKLVLADMIVKIQEFGGNLQNFGQNLVNLKAKLPDMSNFSRKSVSQIHREFNAQKGETEILDITKIKDDEEKD